MWECFKNRVHLRYLPPHSSHKTQPLDVGIFGPVKKYYSEEIKEFASFDTSAPIQKRRFLRAYRNATEKAFTPHNIRQGFRASGCWPVNAETVKNNIGSMISLSKAPPTTPQHNKKRKLTEEDLVITPKSARDLKKQLKVSEGFERRLRVVAWKAGKQLDIAAAEKTALTAQIAYLEAEIDSKKPAGRKAVEKDPNGLFASVEDIRKAMIAAQKQVERREAAFRDDLCHDSGRTTKMAFDDYCHQFQLQDTPFE
jgi:hypothetical protein